MVRLLRVMGMPEDIVDFGPQRHASRSRPPSAGRPWLAVRWRCCLTYSRIYRNRDATAYEGRCPRCGRHLRVAISLDGTDARFFEAY